MTVMCACALLGLDFMCSNAEGTRIGFHVWHTMPKIIALSSKIIVFEHIKQESTFAV